MVEHLRQVQHVASKPLLVGLSVIELESIGARTYPALEPRPQRERWVSNFN